MVGSLVTIESYLLITLLPAMEALAYQCSSDNPQVFYQKCQIKSRLKYVRSVVTFSNDYEKRVFHSCNLETLKKHP